MRVARGIDVMQNESEFKSLLHIYRKLNPIYTVEIGSRKGGTLWYWLRYAQRGAHIISVDCGPDCWEYLKFDKKVWQRWVRPGTELHTIIGYSEDRKIIKQVRDICPHIDFLFIDGDHTYKSVKRDYKNYGSMVRVGGVIAIHDIIENVTRPNYGVHLFYDELKKTGIKTREFVESPGQVGRGIGVIFA